MLTIPLAYAQPKKIGNPDEYRYYAGQFARALDEARHLEYALNRIKRLPWWQQVAHCLLICRTTSRLSRLREHCADVHGHLVDYNWQSAVPRSVPDLPDYWPRQEPARYASA